MKRWPTKPLGEVLEVSRERIEPTEYPATPFNYIGLESIEGHTGNLLPYQPTPGAEIKSTKNVFHPGEILYGKLRPDLNKVHLASAEGICSTDIYILRPRRGQVHPAFAANYLRSPLVLAVVSNAMAGANLPRIGQDAFLSIPVPVPPLSEQERIVKLLDEADELRKLRAQADRRTDALIPALFHEMFGESRAIRSAWPVRSLGDFITDGPQNGLYKHSSFYGEGTRILRIDAFYDGEVVDLTALKRLRVTPDENERYGLRPYDIVINRVNSPEYLGKSALIPPLPEPTVFESNMMRFTVAAEAVEPGYLIRFLQTPAAKRHILGRAKHSINQSSINQEDVKCLPVPVPPLPLQQEFAQRVAEIRALKSTQAASRRRLDGLFQSLLHRAFSGDL